MFEFKAKISRKILEALLKIHENSLQIGIYLLDLGFDNISYDEQSERVSFIDLENVVLTDRHEIASKFYELSELE
jgi:hypothetical protein